MGNATTSGQAFQGFLVPETGLLFEYSGTTANLEWATPEVASGYAEPTAALIPSGEPTGLSTGQSVYLFPVRGGAPGPDGCSYMWAAAASYSAAVSAGDWRGWDAPTTVRWSRCLDTGSIGNAAIAARSDGTALAFWSEGTSAEVLRYAEFDGDSWGSASTIVSDAGSLPLWPAACTLADDVVALFHLVERATDEAQVDAYFLPVQGSATAAKSVLAVPLDVSTGVTGIVAAASGLNVLLLISSIVGSADVISQYASTDGGRSFDLVETWTASRVALNVVATLAGFVALVDREVSAGSWRHEAIRIGSAFEPLSSASATVLWDARRAASERQSSVIVHDPIGATWILREPADTSTDVADQAVSLDGGATWTELAGGLQSALGGRGWLSGRTALMKQAAATWAQDRAIVIGVGHSSSAVVALHLGGAARRPMPGLYADQGQTPGTYGGRLMWSTSWLATGDDPLGSSGWSTSDTGTVTRTYGEAASGEYALSEAFGSGEATQHQRSIDNDGAEVVLRYVVSASTGGTTDVIGRVVSDGAARVQLEVRYQAGSGAWAWRDELAGSPWTSLGTASAATQAYEVIIAADSVSLRGRIVIRPWREPHNGNGATTYHVQTALTSGATAGNSSTTLLVSTSAGSTSVYWAQVDTAFTASAANLSAATEPTILGRPLSAEVATWLGSGLSLQAVGGIVTGSARYAVAQSSSTGVANLDPTQVSSPRRYFETPDAGYTETITITRTDPYRTGWTSDLYGLHFEGLDGFESLSIELYDDTSANWRSLGTFFCSSESLNWSRRGSVVAPRESGSAGNAVWLDRNELAGRGSWRFAQAYVAPIVENSSGTWVAGSTIAERRPFIRVDASDLADEFGSYDTDGTSGYIRYPNLTVLFQPAVVASAVSGLTTGFSKVRVTVAVNGATTDGVFDITRRIRKIAMGPVVVMPRELTRTGARSEVPAVETVRYPDGDVLTVRRGPRSESIEISHSHSHAPMRYDRWASSAPDYIQASGSGARPLATADDVVGVLRGLWDDADDGARPLVWLPYIDSASSSWSLTGVRAGIYGTVSGAHRQASAVGRPGYNAESKVEAFTFERLVWVRE